MASTNATKSILLEWIYDVKSVLQGRIEAYLQGGHVKIIDAVQKYGYHSLAAFNRAFQSIYGIYISFLYF